MSKIPFCLFTPPEKGKKIVWEITSRCNVGCKHCCSNSSDFQSSPAEEFISLNKKLVKKRIKEMVSFGITEFYISGGEPFLVKNIFGFLELLKRKGAKINIASNGYLLNESTIKKLSKMRINLLHISLDGHLPEIHNLLRGGNFFNKVVKNIKNLRKNKIPTRIGCIIWRRNENYLEEMIKLCIKLKIKGLRFSWLIRVGRFKENPQLYPKRNRSAIMKQVKKLKEKYRNKIKISIHRMPETKYSASQLCPGADKIFFLNPRGKLSPCSWIAKIDSNSLTKSSLEEKSIKELANSKEFSRFKAIIRSRESRSLKGCPFMAKYQNNSYYSSDNLIWQTM